MWLRNYHLLFFALILGISISCTETSGIKELTLRSSNDLRGVVTFICIEDSTNQRSQVQLIEKTDDRIPSPQPNSSCAKYLSELMEVENGCPFPPTQSCYDLPLPSQYARCKWFVIYGPAHCPPEE